MSGRLWVVDDSGRRAEAELRGRQRGQRRGDRRAGGAYSSITYAYDAYGNRTGSGYTHDSGNPFRLVSFGGNALNHDSNGNLTRVGPKPTPLATYSFTPNNLLDVSTAGGVVNRFTYDADDWRVKKAVDGGATSYYVRGANGQLLTEVIVDGTTTTMCDHIYAASRLITVATSTTAP